MRKLLFVLLFSTGLTAQTFDFSCLSGKQEINSFIWEGLNTYYYWQESVPNLADTKRDNLSAFNSFIESNTPEDFFLSLLHSNDKYSWIVDDYKDLENQLGGVSQSNGLDFSLYYACATCNNLVGVVNYVQNGSNADGTLIARGDFFTGVNGTTLTVNNYRNLLFSDDTSYTLNMASYTNSTFTGNGTSITLTKSTFQEQAIHLSKVVTVSGEKIGYLMYNSFLSSQVDDLIDVMEDFETENIDHFVLDLRYNPGGSVNTAVILASMITGDYTDQVFAKQQWNSKLLNYFADQSIDQNDYFVDTYDSESLPSLDLDEIYVLTTDNTASASELIINGLDAYIDVIHIGEATEGKNVGSITVYDYIDNNGTKNPNHNYAMQPIVLKIANANNYADYVNGLTPDVSLSENNLNLGVLGDITEPLFAAAINQIANTGKIVSPIVPTGGKKIKKFSEGAMWLDKPFKLNQ